MIELRRARAPMLLGLAALVVMGWSVARAASAPPPHAWSDPATWSGAPPRTGGEVTIPAGETVLLDVDPPALAKLRVEGRLIVAERDVRVRAGAIEVRGVLAVGSASRPFEHRAEFVLDGAAAGAGVVSISDGGRAELYGEPRVAWTHLANTAEAGARDLTLATDGDWRPGDRLALAPTSFDAHEAEEVVVSAVDGPRVTLTAPLRFTHWGAMTDGIDERAEVGLLTHNVVVRTDPATATPGIGGQVVVMQGGRLRASGVEFAGLGQRGKLGRYPVHFHLVGDRSGSFVVGSSIHHAQNRCLTIHGTSGVRVDRNVAFDTIGYCDFLEDGAETGNVLAGNLGLLTRGATPGEAILDSDVQPATYWIANPDNVLKENAAAGSDGTEFWYALAPHPTGPSVTRAVWSRRTNLRGFVDDVAHSNEMNGLFVDNLRNPPGVAEVPNYSPGASADFRGLLSYKNRRRGARLRGTNLRLTAAHIGDNSIDVTFAGADAVLRESLVVGETGNRTGPPKPSDPRFPIRGFEFYDGRVGVENTRFANFVPDERREAGALGADGYRSTVLRDLDGSVTGRVGASVVIASAFLAGAGCAARAEWNAAVCDGPYGSLFVNDLDAKPVRPGPVRVTRLGEDAVASEMPDMPAASMVLLGNPRDGSNTSFQTNLRAGARYDVRFAGVFRRHLRISLHHLPAGQAIAVRLPQAPSGAVLYGARDARTPLPALRDAAGNRALRLVSEGDGDASAVVDVCMEVDCR